MTFKQSFMRGARVIFVERRVPWIVTQIPSLIVQAIVQVTPFLGRRIYNTRGLRFEYRLGTPDVRVLHEVVDRDEYHITEKTMGPDRTLIDIGAHLGSFSVLAASHEPGGLVFSYEPDSANFRLLTRNIARNGLTNIKAFKCAVAGTPGPKTLFRSFVFGNWAHSLNDVGYSRKVVIDSVTLSQIFEENDVKTCHVLKIDCEGSEYEILMGLPPQILGRIERIVGEWHAPPAGDKERGFARLGEFLEQHGFLVEPDFRIPNESPRGVFQAIRRRSD